MTMFALSVTVNDEPLCTAGAPADGVLGVDLVWVDVSRWSRGHFLFEVGGLDSAARRYVRWRAPGLEIGDLVSVELVDTDVVDPPSERYSKGENYTVWVWRHYGRRMREELSELRAAPRAWARELGKTAARGIREAVEPHRPVAFRVTHNGRQVCTAGVLPPCVMAAHVRTLQRPGEPAQQRRSLHISGLDTRKREHAHWTAPELRVGDTVSFEVLATDHWDAPSGLERAR